MSSAHYFVKNYKLKEVVDLMCYSTRFPHTLTSTQKISRLYRCVLRRQRALTLFENRGDMDDFYDVMRVARERFDRIMEISESTAQFKETIEQYESWVHQSMEPTILINPCRPYSATSGKYYIYNDNDLSYDPFGYYAGAPVGGRQQRLSHLFYQNFPMDSKTWQIQAPGLVGDSGIDSSYTK